jgi:hypothetical protein
VAHGRFTLPCPTIEPGVLARGAGFVYFSIAGGP